MSEQDFKDTKAIFTVALKGIRSNMVSMFLDKKHAERRYSADASMSDELQIEKDLQEKCYKELIEFCIKKCGRADLALEVWVPEFYACWKSHERFAI